jgi:predicted transcriptional regulator of viral defense system
VEADRVLSEIAACQHGIVTRAAALAAGITPRQLDRRVANGRLTRVHPGIYLVAGAPATWEQRLTSSVLAAGNGAVASHGSAAAAWGLRGSVRERQMEVTVHRGRLPRIADTRVHRSAVLADVDVTVVHGMPITSIPRTLVDLSASRGIGWLARAMDDAMRRNLTMLPDIRECANRLTGAPGRRPSVVRLLVDERFSIGGGKTHSWLERVVLGLLEDAGIPAPVPQYEVVLEGHRYFLDFAWPDRKVALEADGFGTHSSYASFHDDRRRDLRLRRDGWDVLHVTDETPTQEIVDTVLDALAL